ncbi:sulfatase [Streptomyces sp. NRRL F-5135]|uniref:sulfatase n=1 Tax=Streptomyces sp. NRRL F-5135 TaxID=1463858 RepID=UPI00099D1001|nr:sulfatase [Streptomyces sp. NRRL F-5135]
MSRSTDSRQLPEKDENDQNDERAAKAESKAENKGGGGDGVLPVPRAERDEQPVAAPDAHPVAERDEHPVAAPDEQPVPARATTRSRVATGLAALLVFVALVLPNQTSALTPGFFVQIPEEGILGAALLLLLPPRPRKAVAVAAGTVLGLLTLLKLTDMGFYQVLDRPFDPVLDWILFDDAESFLRDTLGAAGATGVAIGVVALAVGLLALIALSVVRLSDLMARHSPVTAPGTFLVGTVWVACAALGLQIAGVPVASKRTTEWVQYRADQVSAGIKDEKAFAKEAAQDDFENTPPDELLTALRGKDVIFAFVESYGRSAVEDPGIAPRIDKVLDDGNEKLRAAGFSSRSAFLTSPVSGAGSWMAHTTFMSGLWVDNQQRYRSVTSNHRLTLTSAFKRAGDWRTVGIVPGVTRAWPEGKFFGLDNIYDSRDLGYKGPKFSWAPVPDQFNLMAFERLEHGKKDRPPLMTEMILVSTHNPWAPLPETVGWDELGDGSVYHDIRKAAKDPKEVWTDPEKVRTEYRRSIEYTMSNLIDYVQRYGDEDTVLVVLGDHQPNKTVTGENAGRDVPVSIIAHDPAVLERISGWNWQDGLNPAPDAPVWRMDRFRDRFMTAYGSKPYPASPRAATQAAR